MQNATWPRDSRVMWSDIAATVKMSSELDDLSENEYGILLIPEGENGVCVRVQDWCHRRFVVARGSEG